MDERSPGGVLEFDRFQVGFRQWGRGPHTVLCVNGAQQTMVSWSSFARRVGRELRVLTFDFPGVGRSEILRGPPRLTLDEQVEVIHQVIVRAHGGAPVALFGASWGGMIAAATAVRHPDLVERLLLASVGLRQNEAMARVIEEGLSLIDAGRGDEMGPLLIGTFGGRLPPSFREKISGQFRTMGAQSLQALKHHAELVRGISDAREQIRLDLIRAPTLVINGELDAILDRQDLQELARSIPGAQALMIPDTGHFLHQELDRDFLMDVYRDFLIGRVARAA